MMAVCWRANGDSPSLRRRWRVALACLALVLSVGTAAAMPSYMSYFGLAWNIRETQDQVNLYWAVSWDWDADEVVSELADAKARGMRAIVHTEFAFFQGSGTYANACPYTLRPDAAARWDAFVQDLARQGLLDAVAAFYPVDEPDLCGVSPANVLAVLGVIRAHALAASKPVAVIFTCDIAQKYGGDYAFSGGHQYGEALRAYDWVGVDCYGNNIFTDPAWTRRQFDFHCFCFRSIPGPSYYNNFKAQLDLPRQRVILVPQGFIAAANDGLPDDPQLFADAATADPSVVLVAPFTWFDQPFFPGVRSQPALAQQWRGIGRTIALGNPPNASPPLPAAFPPRLQVSASDVRHFSVYDLDCNTTELAVCAVQLDWQAVDASQVTQLFVRQGAGAPQRISCAPATGYLDIPSITAGVNYTFDLYQTLSCASAIAAGATPVASVSMVLTSPNYQGLWWNSPAGSESGWGLSFAHQGDTIFATWFTFGVDGKPLWLVVGANRTADNVYAGKLYTSTGPPFNAVPFDPSKVMPKEAGTATFTFTDNDNGSFAYTVDGVSQTKRITRERFASPVPTCIWGGQPSLAQATNYQHMWWAAPAGSESGWGVDIAHQGDTIFGTWFTFGLDGKPLWLAVGAPRTGANVYRGTLYTVVGPPFSAVPFDPTKVAGTPVGSATFTFADGNNATFDYTVNGIAGTKHITREVFAPPGTVCR